MLRLAPDTLGRMPVRVARPEYDRSGLAPGIVHLGLGEFARAHLAAATEAAITAAAQTPAKGRRAGGPDLRWGIVGVAMARRDLRQALTEQQGLYTLALRDGDGAGRVREELQVIGCLLPRVLLATEERQAVIDAIAHPHTRIVTLTVTEKGYLPETPSAEKPNALALLVQGLAERRERRGAALTLMSLDNLPSNGQVLQRLVLQQAAARDAALAEWIQTKCTFPGSMVDRIVPRCTDADAAGVSAAIGLADSAPVIAEPYFDWAVEDRFANGRPDWPAVGARLVKDAKPWETLKLRCVNGSHSAIAYLGAMAGWPTVHEAMQQEALETFVTELLREEVVPTLGTLPEFDVQRYVEGLLRRFANPALAHRTQQIAMDGSQKLPQRLIAPLRARLEAGQPVPRLAMAVAAWLHYLRGVDENGRPYPIDDPMADELAAAREASLRSRDLYGRVEQLVTALPLFAPVAGFPVLVHSIASALEDLQGVGVRAALMRCCARR
jgi:fructuronate reductase